MRLLSPFILCYTATSDARIRITLPLLNLTIMILLELLSPPIAYCRELNPLYTDHTGQMNLNNLNVDQLNVVDSGKHMVHPKLVQSLIVKNYALRSTNMHLKLLRMITTRNLIISSMKNSLIVIMNLFGDYGVPKIRKPTL